MPKPRKLIINADVTPYYHCTCRCVRRAFLCGFDELTNTSFEHRRDWIEERMLALSSIFALDIAAYAIMSNHYHIVLHINRTQAQQWSPREVVERWHQLFKGTALSQRYLAGDKLTAEEQESMSTLILDWQARLADISWFMRVLNERIARQANKEDQCKGRFWEARFHSQALLDDAALAACMAYVDLNPIRANMADTLEQSDYTSIKQRIRHRLNQYSQADQLMPFKSTNTNKQKTLPPMLEDYLTLVDWTGRQIRKDKQDAICTSFSPLLDQLDIESKHWLYLSKHFESKAASLVGKVYKLKEACQQLGFKRCSGLPLARLLA